MSRTMVHLDADAFFASVEQAADARLRGKLIKIGAKVVYHSGKIVFQMAEMAFPRELFRAILERIGRLRLAMVLSG